MADDVITLFMSSKKVPESVKPSQAQNEPKPEPEKKRKSPPAVTSQTTTTSTVTKVTQVSTTVSSSQQSSSQIPSVRNNDSSSPPNQITSNTLAMSVANVIAERILTPSPPVHNDTRTVQNDGSALKVSILIHTMQTYLKI